MSDPSNDALRTYGDEQFSEGFDCGWTTAFSAIESALMKAVHHPGSRAHIIKTLAELEVKVSEHRQKPMGERL